MFDRRRFLKSTTSAALVGGAIPLSRSQATDCENELQMTTSNRPAVPRFISTWKFGKPVNEQALATYQKTGSMLDGIEQGIWVAEADAGNASVGLGGIPNADGVVQLDACIMNGPDHNAGAVAGLEDILHPISVARKVMERTKHVMLVGDGARQFATENGHSKTTLLTDNQKAAFKKYQQRQRDTKQKDEPNGDCGKDVNADQFDLGLSDAERINEDHHDTIALVGVDGKGNVFGGCSTSGWGYKVPGRVGDSPIIGSGLYVDNEVGGAGATGIGENVMRYCASFMIVEAMRHGATPQEAIESVIERIARKDPRNAEDLAINFVAINRDGETGAAGTSRGFQYAVTDPKSSEVFDAKALTNADIIEGGNQEE